MFQILTFYGSTGQRNKIKKPSKLFLYSRFLEKKYLIFLAFHWKVKAILKQSCCFLSLCPLWLLSSLYFHHLPVFWGKLLTLHYYCYTADRHFWRFFSVFHESQITDSNGKKRPRQSLLVFPKCSLRPLLVSSWHSCQFLALFTGIWDQDMGPYF